ncbi:MAG: NRDE family protein [Planctomycetes bacterium]|nr:NRDE family protein [Planctomycetota bacterium]
MCSLVVLRGFHADHPIVVAANRDERRDRPAAPPGLWRGQRHRVLSPRDREAGGTWLAIDEQGRFAGLTNLAGTPPVPEAPSRGHLPHLALDQPDLDAALAAIVATVRAEAHAGFQLVLCDGRRTLVVRHRQGDVRVVEWADPVLVVTNEHEPGRAVLRGLAAATAPAIPLQQRLDALAVVLRDPGDQDHHAACKVGEAYGTVSSSLLAVPAVDPQQLVWRYAPGSPDRTEYRNYGNLGRRLLPDSGSS